MNLVANNITDRVLIFHYLSRPEKKPPNILYQNSDIIHKPNILFVERQLNNGKHKC